MVWSVPRSSCRFVFDGDNPVVWLERSRILKIYHEYPQVKRRIKWHGAPNLPVILIYFKVDIPFLKGSVFSFQVVPFNGVQRVWLS